MTMQGITMNVKIAAAAMTADPLSISAGAAEEKPLTFPCPEFYIPNRIIKDIAR